AGQGDAGQRVLAQAELIRQDKLDRIRTRLNQLDAYATAAGVFRLPQQPAPAGQEPRARPEHVEREQGQRARLLAHQQAWSTLPPRELADYVNEDRRRAGQQTAQPLNPDEADRLRPQMLRLIQDGLHQLDRTGTSAPSPAGSAGGRPSSV